MNANWMHNLRPCARREGSIGWELRGGVPERDRDEHQARDMQSWKICAQLAVWERLVRGRREKRREERTSSSDQVSQAKPWWRSECSYLPSKFIRSQESAKRVSVSHPSSAILHRNEGLKYSGVEMKGRVHEFTCPCCHAQWCGDGTFPGSTRSLHRNENCCDKLCGLD